jgi:hypothetical protein
LNDILESRIENLDVDGKLRGNSKRTETQHERKEIRNCNNYEFTFASPVEGIMRIVRGLGNQDRAFISGLFDEMMGSEISHDFRPGENFDMQLFLELMHLPLIMDIQNTWLLNHLVPIIEEKTCENRRCEREIPFYQWDTSYLYGDDATEFASSFSVLHREVLWGPR